MSYKPEIDGLRAVAVFLVLLCHLNLWGAEGGFIGVDVFFVISGFLITSIIMTGIEAKKFSFLDFYARRLIRLYPALIVVVLLTLIAAFILIDDVLLKSIFDIVPYVVGSASNTYFSKHVGYFDLAAQLQPFLHTWTLGVEWQFYIVMPVVIWLLSKQSKKAVIVGLLVITVVSLLVSAHKVSTHPNKAYYLLYCRAFELSMGGVLSFIYSKSLKPLASAVLMFIGLVMITVAAFIYTEKTPFPGWAALLPCLGAMACIYGGKGFNQGNILRLKPLIYLGKISYSIYLVHWPLIVFYQYMLIYREITTFEKWLVFAISIVLGAIIYHGIETKIRWKNLRHKWVTCGLVIAVSSLIAATSLWAQKNMDVFAWRVKEVPGEQEETLGSSIYEHKNYWGARYVGDEDGEPIAILVSDSMGHNYLAGLDEQLEGSGKKILVALHWSCYLIDDEFVFDNDQVSMCQDAYQRALNYMQGNDLPVILIQEWMSKGLLVNTQTNEKISMVPTSDEYYDFILTQLTTLRERLGDRKLILVGAPPYLRLKGHSAILSRPNFLIDIVNQRDGNNYQLDTTYTWKINYAIEKFAHDYKNTYYFDPSEILCPNGVCNTLRDEKIYKPHDVNHFKVNTSRKLGSYVLEHILNAINQ